MYMPTVIELRKVCKQKGITGYSKMRKNELERVVKKKQIGGNKKKITKTITNILKFFRKNKKLTLEQLKELTKHVTLKAYKGDSFYTHNIYDELVDGGKAVDICRKEISQQYIEKTFSDVDANGFFASIGGEYVGFISFKNHSDGTLYLKLVCTAKNAKTKGIPLGQLLLLKMEEYARRKKIKKITAYSVPVSIRFYKSIGYKASGKEIYGNIPIEKILK